MDAHAAIRIEHGTPTDEELAALVGVLLSRPAAPAVGPQRRSHWVDSGRPGSAVRRGPHAWRTAALPR
ncbi:acyl-CoA carboxylase subunit epsilon [Rugosimonospora africana]|uniref:acyl-CoA carboxylase subunit epsilon n=1 Tax=Rugosimonospora africana TaxID=556532 RepID=UPI00194176B6|nr:acyl-CoA carboxylase subunit epsilon [Rugosimonospora africana]